jgi:hypothetical protein
MRHNFCALRALPLTGDGDADYPKHNAARRAMEEPSRKLKTDVPES